MCDDNGKYLIATLYNVILAPNLRNQLLSIITLMNSAHTCLFCKGFWTFFISDNEQNVVTLTQRAQKKHVCLIKTKGNPKPEKKKPRNKFSLEWLHQRLGQRFTRSILDGDTENIFRDIEIRVDPDPFCTACKISTIN